MKTNKKESDDRSTPARSPGGQAPDPAPPIRWVRNIAAIAAGLAVVLWYFDAGRGPGQDDGRQTASDLPSIAVMPFADTGPDQSRAYYGDGVSDAFITSLASQPGLKVIARTSSFSYRGRDTDVSTIAEQLDVGYVLRGSVSHEGEALRINAQLIDAETGRTVWNGAFEKELSASNVYAIRTEIATAVIRSLRIKPSPEDRVRLSRVPTESTAALDLFFKARQLMESRAPEDLGRAAELLRTAIDSDPEFAAAYVALADTLRLQSRQGTLPWNVADQQGMAAIRTALRIDGGSGEAYAALGNLLGPRGEYWDAEEAFKRGIELSPSYAPLYQWYAEFLWVYVARPREAVSFARMSVALDPRSAIINRDYAYTLVAAGRFDEAVAQYKMVIDIDPAFAPVYNDLGVLYHGVFGRIAEAIPLIEKTRAMSPSSPYPLISLAAAYVDLDDLEAATDLLDEARQMAPGDPRTAAARVVLAALKDDPAAARTDAETVLENWPWHVPTLRYLRDKELAAGNLAAAFEPYEFSFAKLLGDAPPSIGPSNFAAAIDIAYLLVLEGRPERAEKILRLARPFIESRPRMSWFGSMLADVRIQAVLGNNERALALLKKAVDDGWRVSWRYELEHDLALSSLRETPGYAEIIETLDADMQRQRNSLASEPGIE